MNVLLLLEFGPPGVRHGVHGELTLRPDRRVAGAALETSLTVEEADRLLSALATKGHLGVTVEHGRLLYSLWEGDAPLGG